MKKSIMAAPTFIASAVVALPVLTCPACWPLYAGLLSALGLGFVNYTPFLLPVTILLLIVSAIPLAWKAQQRRGYKPLLAGLAGIAVILSGKFWIEDPPVYYAGIAILLAASIWNIWPKSGCSECRVAPTNDLGLLSGGHDNKE